MHRLPEVAPAPALGGLAPACLLLLGLGGPGCASEDYIRLYGTSPTPPGLSFEDLATMDYMGPTIFDGGVNFCVYSENATRLELALFDDPEATLPTWQFEMQKYGDGIWNLYVEGIGAGHHYGFIAWGPNWPYEPDFYPGSDIGFLADADEDGNRFNPNKLILDPYARAYHRGHDWGRGSVATGPWRTDSTYAAASKGVVVESGYTWSEHEESWRALRAGEDHPGHDWTDLIIYEVHPKGFTANTASGVEHPGTYKGFGEKAAYLADLGVTAVELLPIHMKEYSLGGYWGYSNLSFFAPELGYSAYYQATGKVDGVLDEFKEMVDQLHQHGIEVILDVVYNHTGEGGLWEEKVYHGANPADYYNIDWKEVASIYNLRGLDNSTYYVVSDDGQGFPENTGVGHDVRANHPAATRLILDSLRFYVEELHVDGFRFDLAAILGQVDGAPGRWDPEHTVLKDIIDDPVLKQWNTRIIAEPWSMGSYQGYNYLQGSYPVSSDDPQYAWLEWNDAFRDWWRHFLNGPQRGYHFGFDQGMYWDSIDGGATLTGSAPFYGGKKPYHGVNFVTVHDGYTLYDLFSFDEGRNFCGPLNPVCCNDPYSVWCDLNPHWDQTEVDWGDEDMKRQLMRNVFTALMVSRGTPMLLGGDEWMRTQYGNNNAFTEGADNPANWFRWGEWLNTTAHERHRMHDFVRGLISLRKDNKSAFSPADWTGSMTPNWKNAANADKTDWSDRNLMLHYAGGAADDREVLIIVNMEDHDVEFTLPGGRSWGRVVDTGSYWDTTWYQSNSDADPYRSMNVVEEPVAVSGAYTASSYTMVVLVEN